MYLIVTGHRSLIDRNMTFLGNEYILKDEHLFIQRFVGTVFLVDILGGFSVYD